jgi:GT2 family glycosyltransferase
MVAGTLAASGWWVGDEPYAARGANPKGFFETAEINGINEELLARVLPAEPRFEHGQRWLATLAPGVLPKLDDALRARIARLVAHRPFAFKDPRLCYTLPAWEPLLPAGTGRVCVFREPSATAASIVKECRDAAYLASLAMDESRALEVWTSMYERVLEPCASGEWLFVHYDQMLTQDGLDRLERFAGAPLERSFPEASLRRSRERAPATGRAAELYRELCERAGHSARTQVALSAPAPELSVILCTYQRREILQRSIASFEAQDAPPGTFELLVVDDGSSDGSADWLDAHEFAVPARVLHKPNGGLASARNAGISIARGRLLLFVNDDTLAFPDLVREHLRAHAELAAHGVEASVLGTFEQPNAHLGSALMRHLEGSSEVFRYHDLVAGEFYDHNRFWTCNVSAPAERVRAAGSFDERFKRYGCEDIDLGLRLERMGLRVCYHAGARAHHDHVLDFEALRRRQLSCSASFVHLFAKHPSELDHPDWTWLAGRGVDSMRAELAQRAERRDTLEAALATLARVELPPLEALGERELVDRTLARLSAILGELNALWWQAGLVQGLTELGVSTFAELRAREPQTAFGGWRRPDFSAEHARTQLALLRNEARSGASALATLRAIGLCCALEGTAHADLLAEALSDLEVLRESSEPRAALPQRDLVEWARKSANVLRARVLWLGEDVPRERLLAAGARSVDCATNGITDAGIDVVIGAPPPDEEQLREIARVLRPGGRWVLGPTPELAELPESAHLRLDARELRWYLERTAGAERAAALLERVNRASRLCVAQLEAAGFDCRALEPNSAAGLQGLLVRRGRAILIGA